MNEIIDHKIAMIQHSLARIHEVYYLAKDRLDADLTSQESIIFNLQRASQASVDIANCFNKTLFSKFPNDYRDSFDALHTSGLISTHLALSLQELIDFRSSAIRNEQTLNFEDVKRLVENRLSDFEDFINSINVLEV